MKDGTNGKERRWTLCHQHGAGNSSVQESTQQQRSRRGRRGMSWEAFDKQQKELLYKLWNRMTSGSYFPQATREVIIPKAGGGERRLGIPILLDRIAQQVVVDMLEPLTEKELYK